MRIYITHAEVSKSGGSNDPEISRRGIKATLALTKGLIQLHGPPTLILSSPYLSCRQTSLVMSSLLEEMNIEVEVKIDVRLANYLPKLKNVQEETTSFGLTTTERFVEFEARVRAHNELCQKFDDQSMVFWIISHELVISKLAQCNGLEVSTGPETLAGIICSQIKIDSKIIQSPFVLQFGQWGAVFERNDS